MEQDKYRNPDGTFKPGVCGNPKGRPVDTLKAFLAREFREMSDDEKRAWIKENKISGEVVWKMAEGNPSNHQTVEATVDVNNLSELPDDELDKLIKEGESGESEEGES